MEAVVQSRRRGTLIKSGKGIFLNFFFSLNDCNFFIYFISYQIRMSVIFFIFSWQNEIVFSRLNSVKESVSQRFYRI